MQITMPQDRTDVLVEELTSVWRASVEATHDFLGEQDVERIAQYVPEAIRAIRILVTARDDNGRVLGFAGVDDGKLEMLFIGPAYRGKGVGATLLDLTVRELGVTDVDVNEQNAQARGFYEHEGFEAIRDRRTRRALPHSAHAPESAMTPAIGMLADAIIVSPYRRILAWTADGSSSYCTSFHSVTPRTGRTLSRRYAPSRSWRSVPKLRSCTLPFSS